MNCGPHPQKSTEPRREVETEVAGVFEKWMGEIKEEAATALEKAVSDMKKKIL